MAELFLRKPFREKVSSWKNFCFIHEADLAAKKNGEERKGQKQQPTWEMESHDSKNEIKWRRNFCLFPHYELSARFYNQDDDNIQRERAEQRKKETIKYVNGNSKRF